MLNEKFSRGRPRMGQWVLVSGEVGIVCAPLIGEQPLDPDYYKVDFVDAKTGFHTVGSMRIRVDKMEPLLDLAGIPKPRRDTMAEGWRPMP